MNYRILIADGVRELNSQFWLLHAASLHTARRARALRTLDGTGYQKLLDVALPGVPDASHIRLRNRHSSEDLDQLARTSSRWLPAYFVLLTKSVCESTVHALIEDRVANNAQREQEFRQYRRKGRRKALARKPALQHLAQAACRGDFDEFAKAFPLAPARARLDALKPQLRRANRVRNGIAHELARHIRGTPGVSVAGWQSYAAAVQDLVSILAQVI